ncbi:NTP pyrophosphohydrolase [Yersinia ruckeri]|uniref:5-methyl-dCTP pyrophosphohydrolase n=1 Tax=Yersinia ruckeri TaxID=29486 RepID=A0A085U8M4_YERRU|nr:pyrimidine (deoxy)nucleoside triphosphate diphosphatase [Yersinia ruckeri]EEP99294.1 NUDIX hydrolase [Yersinia ruckeri ATCC 29473]AKA37150.1 pyrimidine (deoxy)nucleoside triphosphate pyrophosphohydrolase [Yersinia ruckeri]ARZ01128.1 pyrimidine (deoxy)nucleoside triphosphate pyrophosphohydrolase [Yersinia ruckeri]EKN4181456.1 pyrimidine (deoxy)nucleoside triphosphate diphosphatase [Yersinia ruckeri]EKN4196974.1 pyrimidine (deoxy)nucleoside triphosphate diphosphatase [Yersinia ruckeri]
MKIIDVVAAIIQRQDKILLAQRGENSDQAGLWEFPGGKVDVGESQPQALRRELAEELMIEADIGHYIASQQSDLPSRRIYLHAWHVAEFRGEPQIQCHSAIIWVTPEQARHYPLAPADIPLLEAFITQQAKLSTNASDVSKSADLFRPH